jgi:hypothetical protein
VEPGTGLILVILRVKGILQRNFFSLELFFSHTCADFFFCLSDHRNKTKGQLWGLFDIDGVPFCESLTNTKEKKYVL